MEYNLVDVSSSEKEIEVKLTYEEIKDELESEVKKESKKIQIPGFRKGKAPLSMIKKFYGDSLEYDASEKVANNWFWKLAEQKDLRPISRPSMTDIQFEPTQELSFKVKYEIIPILELKDYKGLSFEVPEFIVKDTEVDREINYILQSNQTTEAVEVVGDDDNFIIDVEAIRLDKDGNPYEGTKAEKFHLHLNDEKVQPEIKANAKGKIVGDTFEYSFIDEADKPDDSGNTEKIREEIKYKFNILGIKKIILPLLNEEFIKNVTKDKVSNEAELRENIKNDLQNYYNQKVEEISRGKLISEIIKNNDFTPPASLVSNILKEYIKSEEEQAKKNKNKFFDKEEAEKRLYKSAENEVKWYLIKNQIVKNEDLQVSDEELAELAKTESETTGLPVEKLLNYYKSSNHSERIIDKKLFDFLEQNNTIIKVDPENFNKKVEATNEQNS